MNMMRVQLFRSLLSLAVLAATQTGQAQTAVPAIIITGADSRLEENIRAHLSVESERCNSPQRRLNRLLPQVSRDVERAAQALGYYTLEQSGVFTAGEPCWSLSIDLTTAAPVQIGTININVTPDETRTRGQTDPFAELLRNSPLTPGGQLIHSNYENLKASLSAVAVENGYFAARFSRSELAVDLQRNRADVHIDFDPGERYRFGAIRISPIEELSDSFISRFVPFEEGSPYSTEMLIALRQSLNDSQYFSQVAVTPQLNAAQTGSASTSREVPVDIELAVRPRRSWTVGMGMTTDIGPRVTLAHEDRYINRLGHRLSSDIGISPLRQEPNLSYVIPLRDPATESLSISTGYVGEDTDTFVTDTYKVGVSYRSTIDAWILGNDWLQNIFINYQRENSELNAVRESSNLTISGINWARTQADDPIFPTRGWRLFTQISGASNAFLSDMSFVQIYASGKVVQTIGPGRALLRMEAATTIVDGVEELPVSIRFFTGGDQSVRGYQYRSLGALNDQGEVIGGKHLLTGSAEYDFDVRPGWKGAVFVDAGNSFADFADFELYKSAGLGIRWMSPIGPIRADVAKGLDDGSFRLHITMGPDL
ncbi:MAG: autotransporter assembly complex family protein [Gammaproteobacteria bacterium]|nr:autotransporter assembly complex family protein [Gammaproteobacteria bacterium]MDP2142286.1 autotransporter assembly complex family protein [Gammaproteobacteria bacterium]MDP2347612.1 autotransporter assembly complex family protein [Gammaproteobacteria bacterium]